MRETAPGVKSRKPPRASVSRAWSSRPIVRSMADSILPPTSSPPSPTALVAGPRGALLVSGEGEIEALSLAAAGARAQGGPPLLVCHARALATRLSVNAFPALDLLELFAFVRPAAFCLPTPRGLARALDLVLPESHEDEALALLDAARALLDELAAPGLADAEWAPSVAETMRKGGWLWADAVLDALAGAGRLPDEAKAGAALAPWLRLEEWGEVAPPPPPGGFAVSDAEARGRLAELLGLDAEARPQQADYASAAAQAFAPREEQDAPQLVLAEAGTGVGKTLGYIAPASVWAEKNDGAVWLSTFTRNLQHQLDRELDRLYPDPAVKARKVVVRKGRENYLCLLNFEEAANRAALLPADRVGLGLMARWAAASRDGDMVGGDFPAWLAGLVGRARTLNLTDRRGECVYSACPHYRKCFIESSQRNARRADIVIANHALVMARAAFGAADEADERTLPVRYVFDEGHHLFNAADSAFSSYLSGLEAAELRRWVRGAERERSGARTSSRARGLERRAGDLLPLEGELREALDEALKAAGGLPGEGWRERLAGAAPRGPAEGFLAALRAQIVARAEGVDGPYSLEAEALPLGPGVADAALELDAALARLGQPLVRIAGGLAKRLDAEAESLDSPTRLRIEAVSRGLLRRGREQIASWRAMLQSLGAVVIAEDAAPAGAAEGVVDWFALERIEGRDFDVGMRRHALDPTVPFARFVLAPAHGALITSASLRDGTGDVEADWRAAEARTGALHLARPALRAAVPSPFDYAAQTRLFVVTDLARNNADAIAAAYRALFLAAQGGALGLFTAIARLREVHGRIAGALDEAGLPLLAQHIDGLDTTTLVEIFRAERDACLLGTDAVRDGVDVPGRSLRLIVFDRVPWPRPDILHKARRNRFGAARYDDMLTRLRLKQAFGRLIRSAGDVGCFVLLDSRLPSRLAGAFPDGVEVHRVGLAEAVDGVRRLAGVQGGARRGA